MKGSEENREEGEEGKGSAQRRERGERKRGNIIRPIGESSNGRMK